ncbi:MAG: DUF2452 domain-containing protein [Filimonas sp.]|nr:DUF2452 domain-containing protein [Filimonas sp.]
MVQAYNFLASWQLFPERCVFEFGAHPKSGNYKIESIINKDDLQISINWVTLDNEAFYSQYTIRPDGELHPFENQGLADSAQATIVNSSNITIYFIKQEEEMLSIVMEIMPNGYLKITQKGTKPDSTPYTNIEIYHKQLSVLPYASSVGSVAVRPTEEGMIKHKALQAMEEQTDMHLNQIKEQIELLARQAQEIRKRRELSLMIYNARLSFQPVIGQVYHLYQKQDDSYLLSLVSPQEWGNGGPFKQYVSSVKLLADHTWMEAS